MTRILLDSIPGPPFGFSVWRSPCPFFKHRRCACACVWACVCVCVHVCSLLALSSSARPLCQHTLQRAPRCHSRRHTAPKNVTIRGRGETKTEEWWCGFEVQQTPPLPQRGSVISSVIPSPLCTTTHVHAHTQCFIWGLKALQGQGRMRGCLV